MSANDTKPELVEKGGKSQASEQERAGEIARENVGTPDSLKTIKHIEQEKAQAVETPTRDGDKSAKPLQDVKIDGQGVDGTIRVPAHDYEIKKNDTLSHIAQRELGPGASRREIYNFVNEIARKNKLADPDLIIEGKHLQIPEHSYKPRNARPVPEQPGEKPADKPGEKPADKPGEKPADKPGEKPADKPGEKPADKPGENPADKPGEKPADKPQDKPAEVPPVSAQTPEQLIKDAEAIRKATGNDNYVARWSDNEKITDLLKNKTEDERKALDSYYKERYGKSLSEEMSFMSGADRARFEAALNRKDGNLASQGADTIHTNLVERGQIFSGRSDSVNEQAIRDTLRKSNSMQIAEMELEYKAKHGISLSEAISKDPNLSQSTKEMAEVYLKGSDKITSADTQKLADIALKAGNGQMFNEAMSSASVEARQEFLNNGGDLRLRATFGSGQEYRHALDYATRADLGTATQIRDNTGVLSDNNQGIELALKRMGERERSDYMIGRALSDSNFQLSPADKTRLAGMSEGEKASARGTYSEIDSALKAAGNDTEVAKWSSLISGKDNFVSTLDKHRGVFSNDGAPEIVKSIEDMTRSQWEAAAKNPNSRQEMLTMLKSLNKDAEETRQIMDVFDKKMGAPSFDASMNGQRGVLDALDDNTHWYRNDRSAMVDAVARMTPEEKQKYREDAQFKEELDRKIKETIKDGPALEEAQRLLQDTQTGKQSQPEIITKLKSQSAKFNTDEDQAIRDIRDAMNKDPQLLERIRNPKTEEDRLLSESFKQASREALGSSKYNEYVGELLEKGSISGAKMMELNKSIFGDDEEKTYEDVAKLSPQERQKILSDSAYQEQVLGHLSESERKIALNAASQGEYRAEDKIRSAIEGYGGSQQVLDNLKGMSPADLDRARQDYARKYGTSFDSDVLDKLSGNDEVEARRILANKLTAEEKAERTKDDAYSARSGFGAWASDNIFGSATGSQTDAAINVTNRDLAAASAVFQHVDQKRLDELNKQVSEAVDNHRKSKEAAADTVSDVVIAAGAVGSVIVTGGASVPLIAGVASAAAATKVATRSALMGDGYDFSLKQVGIDATTGALSGATAVLGPAQIGAIFRVGKEAAETAATTVLTQEGAKAVLKEGGEKVVSKGMDVVMRDALTSGATDIPQEALKKVAEQAVSQGLTGEARDKAVEELTKSMHQALKQQFEEQTKNYLQNVARQEALNMGSGAGGNVAGSSVDGVTKWDSTKTTAENLATIGKQNIEAAVSGAAGAFAISSALRGAKNLAHARESGVAPIKKGGAIEEAGGKVETPQAVPDEAVHYKRPGGKMAEPEQAANVEKLPDGETPRRYNAGETQLLERPILERPKIGQALPVVEGDIPPRALKQSNDYGTRHQIEGRIEDGWHNAGAGTRFEKNGDFVSGNAPRPAIVIDRAHDPYLRKAIDDAVEKYGSLPPRQRAEALAKYARDLLKPKNISEQELDNWYDAFSHHNAGKRVYFGEMLKEGKGVCSQQAILFKVLADEFPDMKVTVVRGNSFGSPNPHSLNHAWTEVDFGDGQKLIYDPRQQVFGKRYDQYRHTPGRDLEGVTGDEVLPPPAKNDKIFYQGSHEWKVSSVDGDRVVIEHPAVKDLTRKEIESINPKFSDFEGQIAVRRRDGSIEYGWIVAGKNKDGTFKVVKVDGVKKEVKMSDLYNDPMIW